MLHKIIFNLLVLTGMFSEVTQSITSDVRNDQGINATDAY